MSTEPESRSIPDKTDAAAKPWYRHGWVWFLIGIPASAVISGAITLWIAVSTSDSLVVDDYYKEGRGINQRLEKDQAAIDMGISLTARITPAANGMQAIEVRFAARSGVAAPDLIRLRLSHPTLNEKDVIATLMRNSQGVYQSQVPSIATGRWYAQMEDDNASWRVKATWTID